MHADRPAYHPARRPSWQVSGLPGLRRIALEAAEFEPFAAALGMQGAPMPML